MEAEIFIGSPTGLTGAGRASEGELGELDSVSVELLVASWTAWRAGAAAAGYTRDAAFPGWSGMYVRDLTAAQEASGALVTVNGHGLLTPGEKRRRTMYAAGQLIAVGPISKKVLVWSDEEHAEVAETGASTEGKRQIDKLDSNGEVEYVPITTPTGLAERWNINQAIVTVEDTYFSTTLPNMAVISTGQTPPSPPTPPAYLWGSYNDPMRLNHPAGWVLDNRVAPEVVPGALWRVTDIYAYYYSGQPD